MRGDTNFFLNVHKNLPQIPSCGLIASPVCSGKTTLLSNLFLNDSFYKGVFDYVYILSPDIAVVNDPVKSVLRCHPPEHGTRLLRVVEPHIPVPANAVS